MAGIKPKNTVVLLVKIQLPVIHGDDESPYLGAVRHFRAKVCSNNVTGGGRPSNGFDQPILLEKDELSGIHISHIVQIFAPCYIEDRVLCWQNDFVIFKSVLFAVRILTSMDMIWLFASQRSTIMVFWSFLKAFVCMEQAVYERRNSEHKVGRRCGFVGDSQMLWNFAMSSLRCLSPK